LQISSKYSGIIKKIHYQKDEIAKVGMPLYDIDVEAEEGEEDAPVEQSETKATEIESSPSLSDSIEARDEQFRVKTPGRFATLATPAVRHLSKKLDIDISQISGSGKDGRVLKEDVQRFAASSEDTISVPSASDSLDAAKPLTLFQTHMFKTMTKSLSIPHFLFSDTVSLDSLSTLRKSLKADKSNPQSISPLPFIIKAISLAFKEYPLLNSHLDASGESPNLTQRSSHNFGIAIDTPSGLVVPVIKDVQSQTVASIATQIAELASRARQGKLTSSDLKDATFTISNVGSISGGVVAPVITSPQVGIVGIGKSRVVPAFDQDGNLVRREELTMSWSADHRVVDGAMVARAAELVKQSIEDVGKMLLNMR
jgi:2-oxoisovalerate dehydrogenase E2 component (dihydrolipoyl transacylase)